MTDSFRGFGRGALTFLRQLRKNNKREWFQANREAYDPSINERRQMEKYTTGVEKLYRPKGCTRCKGLGYSGRLGVYELFIPDDAVIERISAGANLQELKDLSRKAGMRSLRHDGIDKVKSGVTTLEEIYRVTA